MKILKRILFILLIVLLTVSLSLNVILSVSHIKKDELNSEISDYFIENSSLNSVSVQYSKEQRAQLYETAYNYIVEAKHLTITNEMLQTQDTKVKETITCSMTSDESSYNCSMSSRLYTLDNELIRTSYFPGDGYKYSLQDGVKTKSVYSNESLTNYFYNLINGAVYYLYYMAADSYTVGLEDSLTCIGFSYLDTSNNLALVNGLDVTLIQPTYTIQFSLNFDIFDALTKIDMKEMGNLNISYNKIDLVFPSFEGYTEA